MRLAKYLAHAGVASRRKSEEIVAAGRVRVAGKVITDPAFGVEGASSIELVSGARLSGSVEER